MCDFFKQYVHYFFYVGTAMAMPYRAHLCDSVHLPMVMSLGIVVVDAVQRH